MRTSPRSPTLKRSPYRPAVEALEERQLLTIFTVFTSADNGDNVNPIPGSLRAAIKAANAQVDQDEIDFNIPWNQSKSIGLMSDLPDIFHPVIINGYTQPGAKYNLSITGENAVVPIGLYGGVGGSTATFGLRITGPNCLVAGLGIGGFKGHGIILWPGADHTTLIGNFIGGNGFDGIRVDSSYNTIGGGSTSDRNLIYSNKGNGVSMSGDHNLVQNNWIGRDYLGNPSGNSKAGVYIYAASFNQVGGGPGSLRGNEIAYNAQDGVLIYDSTAKFNSLASNHIYQNGYNG